MLEGVQSTPSSGHGPFAASTLPRHLGRGALGFGLLAAAFALTPRLGPAALLLAPVGLLVLRGCPLCWTLGLAETLSVGRLRRDCEAGSCTMRAGPPPADHFGPDPAPPEAPR